MFANHRTICIDLIDLDHGHDVTAYTLVGAVERKGMIHCAVTWTRMGQFWGKKKNSSYVTHTLQQSEMHRRERWSHQWISRLRHPAAPGMQSVHVLLKGTSAKGRGRAAHSLFNSHIFLPVQGTKLANVRSQTRFSNLEENEDAYYSGNVGICVYPVYMWHSFTPIRCNLVYWHVCLAEIYMNTSAPASPRLSPECRWEEKKTKLHEA